LRLGLQMVSLLANTSRGSDSIHGNTLEAQ